MSNKHESDGEEDTRLPPIITPPIVIPGMDPAMAAERLFRDF